MSCYFIAQIAIHDRKEYKLYLDGFDEIFKRYDGKVLVVDDAPVVLEGRLRHRRIVIIRFRDRREAKRWYTSSAYQALAQHRKRAAKTDIILARGRR